VRHTGTWGHQSGTHRTVKRGAFLYSEGTRFQFLFTVKSGSFKTRITMEQGREQVTGFPMEGDTVGFDGIATKAHELNVVALEDSVVRAIDFEKLELLCRQFPSLQNHLTRMMSLQVLRDQRTMMLLSQARALERVALFLLGLSKQSAERGCQATDIDLQMTREEIGSFLGLTIETVSRSLARLHNDGLINIDRRHVDLLDIGKLRALLN
jgi:CRP/FNR family transcriptional regulator